MARARVIQNPKGPLVPTYPFLLRHLDPFQPLAGRLSVAPILAYVSYNYLRDSTSVLPHSLVHLLFHLRLFF